MSDYNRYYGNQGDFENDSSANNGGADNYNGGYNTQNFDGVYRADYYSAEPGGNGGMPPQKKQNKGLMVFIIALAAVVVVALSSFAVMGIVNFAKDGSFDLSIKSDVGKAGDTLLLQHDTPKPPATAAGEPLSVREVAEKVRPSVVGIVAQTQGGTGTGSGVIMNTDGYIITNAHVVEGSTTLKVYMDDEQKTHYDAKLIGLDVQSDLAVIKIEASGLTAAEFGSSEAIAVGDKAIVIGNPGGLVLQNSVTVGYVSAINRNLGLESGQVTSLIQTDAAINPGNSGGALCNEYGQVVGINSSKIAATSYEGLGFAIPINTVKTVVDELIKNGYVSGRPLLGITGRDVSELMAIANNVPTGVLIVSIDENSDAYKKGIRPDDIITKFGGVKITGMSALNAEKDKLKAGDTAELGIYRDGKEHLIKVVLSEAKPDTAGGQALGGR